jgi:SAM-dependent methyltransferase
MEKESVRSYANFGLGRSYRQILHALRSRASADRIMGQLFDQVRRDERRMEERLGRPISGIRILEIGPGQGMERARYFGSKNTLLGMDLDVLPTGMDVGGYYDLYKKNGLGRLVKTLGRRMILAEANTKAWRRATGIDNLRYPEFIHGDICAMVPGKSSFDMVMSWSVFEHLPDPKAAVKNVIEALKPGGIFYISIHLYTANNGHHDIRAFTGDEDTLPLWGHLRPSTKAQINPSAYLNEWRLSQYRDMFRELAPGHGEFLECFDNPQRYGPMLKGALRDELAQYTEEELTAVDVAFVWKKPG